MEIIRYCIDKKLSKIFRLKSININVQKCVYSIDLHHCQIPNSREVTQIVNNKPAIILY